MKVKSMILTAAATLTAGLSGSVSAARLTVDDFCDLKLSAPATVKEMRPLNDGATYACISDDGKRIEVFSYKTGKKTSTLFDTDAVKGDVRIEDFDGYSLSDNEKKILLWNDTEKIYRHSFRAEYYVYDILRSTLKRVSTKGAQQSATLSHDGRMVAYQRGNNIFISNLDYDTDNAITTDGQVNAIINGTSDWGYEEEFGVIGTMRWSADDNILAYMRFDESGVPTYSFDNYRSWCDPEPDGDLYPARLTYKYALAGSPNSLVSVHTYDLNNRVTKKMELPVSATDYIPSVEFDGKGENLMVMILNHDQNFLRLFSVNPRSTVARQIMTEKSDAWLSPSAYHMVDYRDTYFVIGSDRTGWRHLYKYDYNGNLLAQLTNGDFNVTDYYGTDAKGNSFVQCTKLGAVNRNVARISTKGELSLLNDRPGWESASFSRTMDYWVRTWSDMSTPPQYTVCTSEGKRVADLELNREYAGRYASAPKMELTKVANAEGEMMNGYLLKPADFDPAKKYPLLMYQYGGPESQEVVNKWRMDGLFFIASQGYVIGAVDGRGTGCRSRQWSDVVYKRLGTYETEDQIAGACHYAALPYVDAGRMACFGWSYGGYMTLMEMTSGKSPFKAGVAMAPVTDWRFYDSIYTERYMLTPRQNEVGYRTSSPLLRSQDLTGRLLIMSGTSDDNVHFYNTVKFASKANQEGKIFDMMAFAGFDHSLRVCNARQRLYTKIVDFLNTNLDPR